MKTAIAFTNQRPIELKYKTLRNKERKKWKNMLLAFLSDSTVLQPKPPSLSPVYFPVPFTRPIPNFCLSIYHLALYFQQSLLCELGVARSNWQSRICRKKIDPKRLVSLRNWINFDQGVAFELLFYENILLCENVCVLQRTIKCNLFQLLKSIRIERIGSLLFAICPAPDSKSFYLPLVVYWKISYSSSGTEQLENR